MNDRFVYQFVVCCLFAFLFTACSVIGTQEVVDVEQPTTIVESLQSPVPTSPPPPTPTPEPIQKTVTIWHAWDDAHVPALVQIIANFQQVYPDVQFDVLYIPRENLFDRYQAEAKSGGGPAILLGPAEWGAPLYDEGLIADLSSLANDELLSNYNQPALEQMRYHGALIGTPYRIQGVVLYRNPTIIPESPDTFDDLVSLARSFTEGETIGADLDRGFYFSGGHLNGVGGRLMDENGDPAFNNESGIAWMELLISFENAGPVEYLGNRDLDLFMQGRVGFIIDGTWNLDKLIENLGEESIAVDPWPTYQEGALAGYVQGNDLFMNSNISDPNRDAAWKFMEYFASPASQAIIAEAGYIPAVGGLQLANEARDRLLTQIMIALGGGAPYPAVPEMEVYLAPMDAALRSVFENGVQPAQALQVAEETINASLDVLHSPPTPSP